MVSIRVGKVQDEGQRVRSAARGKVRGAKVRVCCKIIPVFAAIGARHCFFQFDDGPPWSVALHQTENFAGYVLATLGMDRGSVEWDHGFDQDSNGATCSGWSQCAEGCVKSAANAYPNHSRYFFLGPNSNTFAGNISRACGLPAPAGETGPGLNRAPGWGAAAPAYSNGVR